MSATLVLKRLAAPSRELKILGAFAVVFVFLFFLPVGMPRFDNALMLVLRNIMGLKKTVVYVSLVIVMAALTGLLYGAWF